MSNQPTTTTLTDNAKIVALIAEIKHIYGSKTLLAYLNQYDTRIWRRAGLDNLLKTGRLSSPINRVLFDKLQALLPSPPANHPNYTFDFIDLFAGIGGLRKGFSAIGGRCVLTSEWNEFAVRTYKANWFNSAEHQFNRDIRDLTLSNQPAITEAAALTNIDNLVPRHDVLLAGFPCQPFSLAGVSKKNALGRAHGFACETQGTLFFDVVRILQAKQPAFFVLENVKNLKSHDKGQTFKVIMQTLDELGYAIIDSEVSGRNDAKVIDGSHFLPQHRERIVLVGYRRNLGFTPQFSLADIDRYYPKIKPTLASLLQPKVDEKYILSPELWHYLANYAKKHAAKGNGFGFGLVNPADPNAITRTLSARYYKDGSEILIDPNWGVALTEKKPAGNGKQNLRPRRLTPRECARLMGFEQPDGAQFRIPVSDTQAYRQFGNSVIVPVFTAIAKLMEPWINQSVKKSLKKI